MTSSSVGRLVLFHPHAQAARRDDADQALAAMIVRAHDDDRVNLVVFDQNGVPSGEKDVLLWGGEGDRPLVDYAEWPDNMPVETPSADDRPVSGDDPAQESGEDDTTYRKRVRKWRKEEQARVAADNAAAEQS